MIDIKTVLCPLDFSALSDQELRLAGQICERFGARMILQHNIDCMPPSFKLVDGGSSQRKRIWIRAVYWIGMTRLRMLEIDMLAL